MANMTTTTSNQTTTQTTTHHHDRHNDDNSIASKARWKLLREALLVSTKNASSSSSVPNHNDNNNDDNNNNNNISSTTKRSSLTDKIMTNELNEHDDINSNDDDFHRYSIHQFQGYQFLKPSKTISLQQHHCHEKNEIISTDINNDDHQYQQHQYNNNETRNFNNDYRNTIASTEENSIDRNHFLRYDDTNHNNINQNNDDVCAKHLYNALSNIVIQIPTTTMNQHSNIHQSQRTEFNINNNYDDIVTTTVSENQGIILWKEQLLDQLDSSLLAISALLLSSSFLDTQQQQQKEENRTTLLSFPIHTIPFEIKFVIFNSLHHQDDDNNSENNAMTTLVNNNNTFQSTTTTTTSSSVKYHEQLNLHDVLSYIFECDDDHEKKDHHFCRNNMNTNITFTSFQPTFIMELHQRCLPELYLIDGCINSTVFVDMKKEESSFPSTSFMVMKIQCDIRYKINPNHHHIHTIQRYDWMNNVHNSNHGNNNNNNDYCDTLLCWYTREKLTNHKMINKNKSKKLSLRELASHQFYDNIDNTGNVCVWDCEKIMTWILLMDPTLKILPSLSTSPAPNNHPTTSEPLSSLSPSITILELGVGMAGLAGLALYSAVAAHVASVTLNNKKNQSVQHQDEHDDDIISSLSYRYRIILTDGHPDCVRNNRINIRLCQAASSLSSLLVSDNQLHYNQVQSGSNNNASIIDHRQDNDGQDGGNENSFKKNSLMSSLQIESRLLKWDIPEIFSNSDDKAYYCYHHQYNAHCTIISDCIHFVEYHVELLYTAIQCTNVDGTIWLCQPNRGTSLQKFIQLINVINYNQHEHDDNHIHNKDHFESISIQSPLIAMTERRYDEIEVKHQELLINPQHINNNSKSDIKEQQQHHHANNYYNPDIHKPRIIVLQKLRHMTQADHQHFLANR